MADKKRGIHELYEQDPIAADELVWGRKTDPITRRGFLSSSGLIAMSAAVGAAIPFAHLMPRGLIPAAIAPTTDWKEHFRGTRQWFYTLTLAYIVWAFVQPIIMLNAPIAHPFRIGQLAFASAAAAALLLRSDKADKVFAWVFFGVLMFATYLRIRPEPWWLQ